MRATRGVPQPYVDRTPIQELVCKLAQAAALSSPRRAQPVQETVRDDWDDDDDEAEEDPQKVWEDA